MSTDNFECDEISSRHFYSLMSPFYKDRFRSSCVWWL